MYYMALYLKYFRKSKNTFKWFVFSCVPSQMRILIIWKKNRKAWKEMTKMCRKASVALMGFEPINIHVKDRFLTIQNEVTTWLRRHISKVFNLYIYT